MLTLVQPEEETYTYVWKTCRDCGEEFEVNADMISYVCFFCLTDNEEPTSPVWNMSKVDQNKLIRQGLQKLDPGFRVKSGTGTASWWVDVRGSGEYGAFTDNQRAINEGLGLYGNITPGERELIIFKLYPHLANDADMKKARRYARNERNSWD